MSKLNPNAKEFCDIKRKIHSTFKGLEQDQVIQRKVTIVP